MSIRIDPGTRFGRLITLKPHFFGWGVTWSCWCDCGSLTKVDAAQLVNGIRTNCGCTKRHTAKGKPMPAITTEEA